jgi:hypothetical protein
MGRKDASGIKWVRLGFVWVAASSALRFWLTPKTAKNAISYITYGKTRMPQAKIAGSGALIVSDTNYQ